MKPNVPSSETLLREVTRVICTPYNRLNLKDRVLVGIIILPQWGSNFSMQLNKLMSSQSLTKHRQYKNLANDIERWMYRDVAKTIIIIIQWSHYLPYCYSHNDLVIALNVRSRQIPPASFHEEKWGVKAWQVFTRRERARCSSLLAYDNEWVEVFLRHQISGPLWLMQNAFSDTASFPQLVR